MDQALAPSIPLPRGHELLRRAIVLGCALCLAAAGPLLPSLSL
ncbi:MAG: hypothetical protein ACKOPG_11450 [Novosphingobium sp.]